MGRRGRRRGKKRRGTRGRRCCMKAPSKRERERERERERGERERVLVCMCVCAVVHQNL